MVEAHAPRVIQVLHTRRFESSHSRSADRWERPRRIHDVDYTARRARPHRLRAVPSSAAVRASRAAHAWQNPPMHDDWWMIALGVLGGIVLLWLALVALLWVEQRRHREGTTLADLLRLVPDTARLLKRLATDRSVSLGVRVVLGLLVVYLLSPIDLIPDFIPVLGYADDAIVVVLALRFAIRRAGAAAVERHWPGRPDGLAAVLRLAGIR
jgi:uncharacterized membrane protein YkvA (DUF1232 family)